MLLAVDVGNSSTVIGLFDGDALAHDWRVSTDGRRTADELVLLLHDLLGFAGCDLREDVSGVVVASVVPPVGAVLEQVVDDHLEVPSVVVQPGTRTGIALRYDDPREMGADRIANAVAAVERYGAPAIVVDFGTSTNVDVVDRAGAFVGGAIAPGVTVSTQALVDTAAQLPEVIARTPPRVIGRTTVEALQAGIVYGFAGQVDGLVERIADEVGPGVTTIATGGAAPVVLDACASIDHHDAHLTLHGLRVIWSRNRR